MESIRGRAAALHILGGLIAAILVTLVGMLILAALVVWAGLSDTALTVLNQVLKIIAVVFGTWRAVRPGGRFGLALGGSVGLIYIALGYGVCALTGPLLVTGSMLVLELTMGLVIGALAGIVTANVGGRGIRE